MTPDTIALIFGLLVWLFWITVLLTVLLTLNSHGKKIKAMRAEIAALRAERQIPTRTDPELYDRLDRIEAWAQQVTNFLQPRRPAE